MAWLQPPITGDHKLDAWTLRLTQQINQGVIPGAGGASIGGGGGAESNTALYLYQRTLTDDAPNRPTAVVFNFRSDPAVQSADEGWSGSIPPQVDGDYLWVTFRYVSATAGSINDVNSWDTPALLSTPTAAPGRDAIVVQVSIRTTNDTTTDPATWALEDEGIFFRNNMGDTKYLVATVFIGGAEQNQTAHAGYTYAWQRNGLPFTPSTGNAASRFVTITADNVEDGGADQFSCVVNTTPGE